LVVAPHLVLTFPFLQIIADIVKPAAILTDAISGELYAKDGSPLRKWLWENRGTPRVANMLKEYECKNFDEVHVDRSTYGTFSAGGFRYWLWRMELWSR
ncbi:hypothetical protein DM02DRAFT_490115, partial [Periconia macrospinosa]